MKEVIDLYDVNREHTKLTAVRGEKLPEDTYRMVVHVDFSERRPVITVHRGNLYEPSSL